LGDPLHESGRCLARCCSSRIWHFRFEIVDSITRRRLARCFSRAMLLAWRTRSGVGS
jgi:hypothetical protein